jgi:hypothetical protein
MESLAAARVNSRATGIRAQMSKGVTTRKGRLGVGRVGMEEVLLRLPEIRTALLEGRHDDVFICALGFEERCLCVSEQLNSMGYTCDIAVCLTYRTNMRANNRNRTRLLKQLGSCAGSVVELDVDSADFSAQLNDVIDGLNSVCFDITVAASRAIVRTMATLLDKKINLSILYAEAAIYRPSFSEYRENPEKWQREANVGLEWGISDIRVSPEYPGEHLDSLPDRIILFPNFRIERSQAVLAFVDPNLLLDPGDSVIWVLGMPHLDEDRWRLDAMRAINQVPESSISYEMSTFEYKESLGLLEKLYDQFGGRFRLSIAPMGSKLQTLAVTLFCDRHRDVRVILTMPKEYNASQYSHGCKEVWAIDFLATDDLRVALREIGSLRIYQR